MLDKNGTEVLDDTPVEVPLGYRQPKSLGERVKELMRVEFERRAADIKARGYETFEEANDFAVDDFDPKSPYELSVEQELEGDPTLPVSPVKEDVPAGKKPDTPPAGADGGDPPPKAA